MIVEDKDNLEMLTILRVWSENLQTSPTSSNACSAFDGSFILQFDNDH